MKILIVNAGSSSLKFQVRDTSTNELLAEGVCEKIGQPDSFITYKINGEKTVTETPMKDHGDALNVVFAKLTAADGGVIKSEREIDAVGHRVLHGGETYGESVLVTDEVMANLEKLIPLGPLHMPPNIGGILACQAKFKELGKDVPQVAVFDTAFHQTMPKYAYTYALPAEYYEKYQVRRYGFHGTSHSYVSKETAKFLNREGDPELKIITCHLGNGSSFAAVKGGKCQDTSMGLTPLEGIPMGTRSGSIDPAIVEYIIDRKIAEGQNVTAKEVINELNKKSGMFGVSGGDSDFRNLDERAKAGDERAQLALDVFSYNGRKLVGSYAAALGGVDAIVFTAGIGENDAAMRRDICNGLSFMGAKLDEAKNDKDFKRGVQCDISAPDSTVKILVIPTNEELVIAQDTARIVGALK